MLPGRSGSLGHGSTGALGSAVVSDTKMLEANPMGAVSCGVEPLYIGLVCPAHSMGAGLDWGVWRPGQQSWTLCLLGPMHSGLCTECSGALLLFASINFLIRAVL